jgi:dolichol-phosphate mannosyltransferase
MADHPDVTVVTVTYNERENVSELIQTVEKVFQDEGLRGEIIVVDDNSKDGTGQAVRDLAEQFGNIRLIARFGKFGIASAYERGINNARGMIIVTMDADLSHPPDRLSLMLAAVREGYVAAGSRFVKGSSITTSWVRHLATRIVNFTTKHLVQTGINDHTNGYIAISRENLIAVRELGGQYDLDPFSRVLYGIPVFVLVTKLGLPAKEIITPYRWRQKGKTKLPFFKGAVTILSELLYLFRIAYHLRKYNRDEKDLPDQSAH